jgi:ABC-type lipoprotein release transport system permease subunit
VQGIAPPGAVQQVVVTALAGGSVLLAFRAADMRPRLLHLAAALAGIVLEAVAFGPLVARLAAGFAALPLAPTSGQVALVAGGLLALAAIATALVARRVLREPVVAGLREE